LRYFTFIITTSLKQEANGPVLLIWFLPYIPLFLHYDPMTQDFKGF